MNRFSKYLEEIKERENIGLSPKPIDSGELLKEIVTNPGLRLDNDIKDKIKNR